MEILFAKVAVTFLILIYQESVLSVRVIVRFALVQ
jgi:hypothetical protein